MVKKYIMLRTIMTVYIYLLYIVIITPKRVDKLKLDKKKTA